MPAQEIHIGDIGTAMQYLVKDQDGNIVDLSLSTVKTLIIRKPDTSRSTHDLAFYTNGTDGIVQWVTTTISDFDQSGIWRDELYLEISGGKWNSDVGTFRVYPNI